MEEKIIRFFTMIWGFIGGGLINSVGGADILLKALITLIVLDYITGVLKAIYLKKLNSTVGVKGIIKKVIILFVVAASVAIQNVIKVPVREIVVTFFICNEGFSFLENAGEIVPLPDKIKQVLEKLQENNGGSDGDGI